MKVIVAGSRDYSDRAYIYSVLDRMMAKYPNAKLVSGMARGVDTIAFDYGYDKHIKVYKYPADWDKYGKSAGYKRNVEMAENATHLIAFWDGVSKGTKNMIDIARDKGLKVRIIRV